MSKELELLKEYYSHILERLNKTQLSTKQKEVYHKLLDIFKEVKELPQFFSLKSYRDLDLELAKAAAIDNWTAKSEAAGKGGDLSAARAYSDIARKAATAGSLQELGSLINAGNDNAIDVSKKQEEIKDNFVAAVQAVFESMKCHKANSEIIKRLSDAYLENDHKLEKNGISFSDCIKDPYFRSLFPFPEKLWEGILFESNKLRYFSPDIAFEKRLKAEQDKAILELRERSGELSNTQKSIDMKVKRRIMLASAPKNMPGSYIFETMWEGPDS